MKENADQLVEDYQTILCNSATLDIVDLNVTIAKLAAGMRAKYNVRTPDSIQLATAIHTSCDFFLTNDIRLKSIKELNVVVLDEVIAH